MDNFNKRYLMYETAQKSNSDYGEVINVINDKMIDVNIGGEKNTDGSLLILNAVSVEGDYVPKVGDWVGIEWKGGQPVAIGGNGGLAKGLNNINNIVKIVSTSDMAGNVVTSDHIQANSILAYHISANSIEAQHISANAITTIAISANAVTADKIAVGVITAEQISANSITGDRIAANTITAGNIQTGTLTALQISAGSITGDRISGGTIDASLLNVSARVQGLLGSYYQGVSANGSFMGNRIEGNIDFDWGTGAPSIVGTGNNWSVRWQGMVYAPQTGQYQFFTTADDGSKLWIDNQLVIDAWTGNVGTKASGIYTLSSGNWYLIRYEYYQTTGNANVKLEWQQPSDGISSVIPAMYLTQANTTIDGGQILTDSITAANMKVGTITAESGILADASITTAVIADGIITSAKIANGEIKTANIASGNITTALIGDLAVTNAKIQSLDASKITSGYISAILISAGTITGDMIAANTISGNNIAANTIDTLQLKAGAVTATKIAAGAITTDRIAAGAITGDKIMAGSITSELISTVGLDAQMINVYDSKTGQTLIGGGYLVSEGLDVGVVQSDNLVGNGLFLQSSSGYGFKRDNPSGEALLGSNTYVPGGSQVWKIDASNGAVLNKLDITARKPYGIDIDASGNYGYVTVQGDNTLVQIDMSNFVLTGKKINTGMGPALIKWVGSAMELGDMKHLFLLNTDPTDMNIPDSLMVIDAPPNSINQDLYVHHQILLGNTPYDFALDEMEHKLYVTQAGQGDIAIIDLSSSASMNWHVAGAISIAAYGTDNYHGGVPAQIGLGDAVGGDASALYNASSMGMESMGMGDAMDGGSYAASNGTLKTYEPHGIALSSDSDTLYVVDYANGELCVVSKSGSAPYNSLTGRHDISGNSSPAMSVMNGEQSGGGPTTKWVWYRIALGDEPESIEVVNGKLFITLEADNQVAVITESDIIDALNTDRTYYATWTSSMPMNPYPTISVRKINVGANPSYMKVYNDTVYISLSAQNQIAVIDSTTETVTSTFSVGPNPKGVTISPDGAYLYVVNNGGSGDLSFVYPSGDYIGDAYLGLEGMVEYQGAEFWTPDRSDWVYDVSGNIQSSSTIEFRINEPFLNEGGYVKFVQNGIDYQYSMIEQDAYNVVNYSNGNNVVVVVGERLMASTGNTYYPKNEWLSSPVPIFNTVQDDGSGGTIKTPISPTSYTIGYGSGYNSKVVISGGAVPSGNWVEANYTAKNNLYFRPHNGSIEVALENSSSPNFITTFEIDEFVPKFISVDNQQTSSFTPTGNGITDTYTGLEYSVMTNRALGLTSSNVSTTATISGAVGDLFDGSTGNVVTIGSGNQNFVIDLSSAYMIGMINVIRPSGNTYNHTVEISEDNSMWMMVSGNMGGGMSSGNSIVFDAMPTRYVRITTNGYLDSGGASQTGNPFNEIEIYGDWEVEYNFVYPENSTYSGQQIATNGKCVVSTDIKEAYVAFDIQTEYTTWWYVTYVVGPGYGRMKVDMPSMGMFHYLFLDQEVVNKIAHRHIMPFPPSVNIKEDMMNNVKAGKHRARLVQDSGKITIDRLRFEDFQKYATNTLLIPNTASTTFTRYKVVAEQAKWFIGSGNQSSEGAYDTPRLNPDSHQPDYSVPIKYRMRLKTELNPSGNIAEHGIAYATSAILETGKQSTHWRRSEAIDSYPGNRIQKWDGNQPHKTGIQDFHLANGAVRGEKILNGAIMDWHVSPYAKIVESKLALNYPTHEHSNKSVLDAFDGLTTGGTIGTGNVAVTYNYLTGNFYTKSQVDALSLSGGSGSGNTVPVTRIVSGGVGISGGGELSSDILLSLDTAFTDARYVVTSGNSYVTGNIYVTGGIYMNGQLVGTGNGGGGSSSQIPAGATASGNFTIIGDGNLWAGLGSSGNGGQIVVRNTSGMNAIQLGGTLKLTNVNSYIDVSGNAQYAGYVSANTLYVQSSANVANLNASYINGVPESQLVKNPSIYEFGGFGVYSGLSVSAQTVPNMTVLIGAGTVYTNTGRRVAINFTNIAISTASATYDRIDAIYVQGSSAGANEGALAVVIGTPSATPSAPSIPSDGVLIANVTVPQNAGSILSSNISDARVYKPIRWLPPVGRSSDRFCVTDIYVNNIGSATGNTVPINNPIKATGWSISITMATGNTSYVWNHGLGLSNYAVTFGCNSPDRHIYWTGKSGGSVIINMDDVDTVPITIDAMIIAL